MHPTDANDRLSATLQSWRVNPPRDPNFRPAVMERIRRNARETWPGYVRSHLLGWSAAAVLAAIAAGWTGHAAARAKIDDHRDQMVVSYLGNLDPRVMAKLRP
jgi:anti-sigma factor RsiW